MTRYKNEYILGRYVSWAFLKAIKAYTYEDTERLNILWTE